MKVQVVKMDVPRSSTSDAWHKMRSELLEQRRYFNNLTNRVMEVTYHPASENLSEGNDSRLIIVRPEYFGIVQEFFAHFQTPGHISVGNWQILRFISESTMVGFNQYTVQQHNPSSGIVGTALRTFSPIRSSPLSSQAEHRSFFAPPFEEGEADRSAAPRLQEVDRGAALQSRAEETESSSQRHDLPPDLDDALAGAMIGLIFSGGYQAS